MINPIFIPFSRLHYRIRCALGAMKAAAQTRMYWNTQTKYFESLPYAFPLRPLLELRLFWFAPPRVCDLH